MEDKIQEIMELVEYYNGATTWGTTEQQITARAAIEPKLRELVESKPSMQEPLSDSQINSMDCVLLDFEDDGSCQISSRSVREFARSIERAHHITGTTKE